MWLKSKRVNGIKQTDTWQRKNAEWVCGAGKDRQHDGWAEHMALKVNVEKTITFLFRPRHNSHNILRSLLSVAVPTTL